jgi:hypothetical protein
MSDETGTVRGWRKYSAMVIALVAVVLPPVFLGKRIDPEVYDIMTSTIWKIAGVYILGNGVSAIAGAFKGRG